MPRCARRRRERAAGGRAKTLSIASAGHGLGEQKALHLVAAGKAQQHPLLVGLDAFGQHLHAERVAERDDRLDDGAGIARRAQRGDEGAVDFEPVEREFLQIAQARIAGAEIVERGRDAKRAQGFELGLGFLRIVDQDAFGHFEHEARCRHAGFGDQRADQIDQTATAHLHRRQVDRHEQVRPARAVGQRAPQHDLAEPVHQPALLGERNEHRRRDRAARRVGPARQRFDADHAAAVGGDDRLIVNVERLLLDRGFEFAQEKAALGMLLVNLRHKAPHRAAAAALGGAQRQRGVTTAVRRRWCRPPAPARCRCRR